MNHEVKMPPGTYAVLSGESKARAQSQRDLLAYGEIAPVSIALLLFLAMKNRRAVLLDMINLPFALDGGVLSMVGFVTPLGLSLRNSIMLISHYEHLAHVERLTWDMDTAVRGASERLLPILMTALVTARALLPPPHGKRCVGQRNRGADGDCHRGRPDHIDAAEPDRADHAGAALWAFPRDELAEPALSSAHGEAGGGR